MALICQELNELGRLVGEPKVGITEPHIPVNADRIGDVVVPRRFALDNLLPCAASSVPIRLAISDSNFFRCLKSTFRLCSRTSAGP